MWVAGRKRVFVGLVVVDHPYTVVVVAVAVVVVAIIFKVSNVFALPLRTLFSLNLLMIWMLSCL